MNYRLCIALTLLLLVSPLVASQSPLEYHPVWRRSLGSNVAVLAVDYNASRVCVGSDVRVTVLDLDGMSLWSYEVDYPVSALAYHGDKVVAALADGHLIMFDRGGRVEWSDRFGGYAISSDAVSLNEEYVAVGSMNGRVYLFNASSGAVLWNHLTGGYVIALDLLGDEVVAVSDDSVNRLDIQGNLISSLNSSQYIRTAILEKEILAAFLGNQELYLLDLRDNSSWSLSLDDHVGVLYVNGEGVLTGSKEGLVRYIDLGGSINWVSGLNDSIVHLQSTGNYVVASTLGDRVYLLFKSSGDVRREYSVSGLVKTIQATDEYILCGSDRGLLVRYNIFRRDMREFFMVGAVMVLVIITASLIFLRSWGH